MKKNAKRTVVSLLLFLVMLVTMATSVSAYGPLTMYTSPASAPAYGALSPRTVQLTHSGTNNGKMYTTWENRTTGIPTFPIYESTNNGLSWAKVGDVSNTVDGPGWGMQNCPQLFELPQAIGSLAAGTLLAVGDATPSDMSATKLEMYKSTDLGRTWTFVSTITTAGANAVGADPVWEPWLLVENNKLIVYYSDERDPAHAQTLVHQTTTDGVNWSSVVNDVVWPDAVTRPGMPIVAKMANGNFIMTFEVGLSNGSYPCAYKINTNAETGWNSVTTNYFLGNSGSPFVTVLSDGRIVANSYASPDIYINSKTDGTGTWDAMGTPIGGSYNRQLLQLSNGRLFIPNGGDFSHKNAITYADMYVPSATGSYRLVNVKSGKVLAIGAGNTVNGANAIQWTYDGTNPEKWQLVDAGGGYKKIFNVKTGKALAVSQSSTVDGAAVLQWNETGSNEFQWSLVPSGSYYKIVNRNSGKLLDVYQGSINDGGTIVQWSDNGGTNQLWQLVAN
ncbi:RICIN domain-containing protein [Paenibacillus sp. LjRoot153]|uniref:RICIN domain-containing protein n=1 Tax=Paenibacillus sp. LjRoot153 TaxID=3342270 RepID=UPI003ECC55B2